MQSELHFTKADSDFNRMSKIKWIHTKLISTLDKSEPKLNILIKKNAKEKSKEIRFKVITKQAIYLIQKFDT